jgi:hypothetical protein
MEIRIVEDKWTAEILFSPQPETSDILHRLEARVTGLTQEDALSGSQFILDLFAKGRLAYIHARPEVHSDRNSNTGEMMHCGYVRFSFRPEPGEWHDADKSYEREVPLCGFGVLESRA